MISALIGVSAFTIVEVSIILAPVTENALTPLQEKDTYVDAFLDMKGMVTSMAQIVECFNDSQSLFFSLVYELQTHVNSFDVYVFFCSHDLPLVAKKTKSSSANLPLSTSFDIYDSFLVTANR
ncbi:hypothetical protein SUGI_0462310 [Cryptomeria japonica]|nr:hypothetical protein SUGI_0462310 [Cryptomeria japonica]